MEYLVEQCLLFLISLIANGLSAMAGGGAGLLQFPALLFLGLSFTVALATHKVASVALGVGATFRHLREKRLSWKFALHILIFGLPGVILGAMLILSVPDDIARIVLGFLTMGLGVYSWLKPELGLQARARQFVSWQWLVGGIVLFLIGLLNGSITSGTGLFVTLWLVRWYGLDYQRAVAYTLILVGMLWNGMGALTLAMQTPVKWEWVFPLVLGALLGGYLGAHLSIAKGSQLVKRCFEGVTILVGLSLIIDGSF
ncbi:MAG: sulfite exporter TauE/SafE family protein [Oleiphilus sp.]